MEAVNRKLIRPSLNEIKEQIAPPRRIPLQKKRTHLAGGATGLFKDSRLYLDVPLTIRRIHIHMRRIKDADPHLSEGLQLIR